jgi:two-component system, sensor histidine kinase YesM
MSKVKKQSIQNKFIHSVTICFCVVYIIVSISAVFMMSRTLYRQLQTDYKKIIDQSEEQLQNMFDQVDASGRQIISDEQLSFSMSGIFSRKYPYMSISNVDNTLNKFVSRNSYLLAITVVTDEAVFYSRGEGQAPNIYSLTRSDWFKNFKNSNSASAVSPVHSLFNTDDNQDCVSLVVKYTDLFAAGNINYLILSIPLYKINDILVSDILITNDYGDVINKSANISSDNPPKASASLGKVLSNHYLIYFNKMNYSGWSLYFPVSIAVIVSQILQAVFLLILIFSVSLFISLHMLSKIIKRLLRPVNTLKNAMETVSGGNLDVTADVSSGDEFEFLADCYNKMIQELKADFNKILENEKIKKQMEMDMLISQVHPHFIYNTLNSAIYMIEEEKNDQAIDTLYALIDILQNVVKLGNNQIFTTVENELLLMDAYARIQHVRYPDQFTLAVYCDPKLKTEYIPQIIIQPLVENALFHGILPAKRPGHIIVTIRKDNQNRMLIKVHDDGIGMTSAEQRDLLQQSSHSAHGVGLANIQNRLSKFYNGLKWEFSVCSVSGTGTDVTILLPLDQMLPENKVTEKT